MAQLTHFDDQGRAVMVDVGGKAETQRVAVARGHIRMRPETLETILSGVSQKGDVPGVARLAGIMGAKRTADLIPLAHPIALTRVSIEFSVEREHHRIVCTAHA